MVNKIRLRLRNKKNINGVKKAFLGLGETLRRLARLNYASWSSCLQHTFLSPTASLPVIPVISERMRLCILADVSNGVRKNAGRKGSREKEKRDGKREKRDKDKDTSAQLVWYGCTQHWSCASAIFNGKHWQWGVNHEMLPGQEHVCWGRS